MTTRELQRSVAVTGLRIVLANMASVRAALLREMPGKMDALADQLDQWCHGIAPAIRELERARSTDREGDAQ